jgi:predicted ester cyclase
VWTDAYPDNEIKDVVLFGEGDLVCFHARFAGTHTGILHAPAMEMPPTGKPIDTPFAHIAELRDGKVMRAWHYYDRLLVLEQEGVVSLDKLLTEQAA